MSEITVVVKEPSGPAERRVIENSFDGYLGIVGEFVEWGYTYTEPFNGMIFAFNKYGRIMDPPLDLNVLIPELCGGTILGPLFVCRFEVKNDDEVWESLRDEEVQAVINALNNRSIVSGAGRHN